MRVYETKNDSLKLYKDTETGDETGSRSEGETRKGRKIKRESTALMSGVTFPLIWNCPCQKGLKRVEKWVKKGGRPRAIMCDTHKYGLWDVLELWGGRIRAE